jgi:uncharacterized lipoprotein YmbA
MSALFFALALLLVGCSSTAPPERSYYLLRAEVDGEKLGPVEPMTDVGLGRISVAPYLNRTGVVIQVDDNQVREARYHLWAEPLPKGIGYYLEDRLSELLGRPLAGSEAARQPRYRIDVDVEEFHGTLDGEARLVARWSLMDTKTGIARVTERLRRSTTLADDGYPSLVKAQTALLDELAERIASALRESGV